MSRYKVAVAAVDGLGNNRDIGKHLSELEELRERVDCQMLNVFGLCRIVKNFEDHEVHGKMARQLLRRWRVVEESRDSYRDLRLRGNRLDRMHLRPRSRSVALRGRRRDPSDDRARRELSDDRSRNRATSMARNRSPKTPVSPSRTHASISCYNNPARNRSPKTPDSPSRTHASISCYNNPPSRNTGIKGILKKSSDEKPGLSYTSNFTWKSPPKEEPRVIAVKSDLNQYQGFPYVKCPKPSVFPLELKIPKMEVVDSSYEAPASQLVSPKPVSSEVSVAAPATQQITPNPVLSLQKFIIPRKKARKNLTETQQTEVKTRSQTTAQLTTNKGFNKVVEVKEEEEKPKIKILIKKPLPMPPSLSSLHRKPAKRTPAKDIRMCQQPPTPPLSEYERSTEFEKVEVEEEAKEKEDIENNYNVELKMEPVDIFTEPPHEMMRLSPSPMEDELFAPVKLEPLSPEMEKPFPPIAMPSLSKLLSMRIPKRKKHVAIPRLFDLCERAAEKQMKLAFNGRVPFSLVEPILEKYGDRALYNTEISMPWLEDGISTIWQHRLDRDFPSATLFPGESPGEAYRRCKEEAEDDLLERMIRSSLQNGFKSVIKKENSTKMPPRTRRKAPANKKKPAKRT